MILAPSILAADFSKLGSNIKKSEKAGAQWLHLDIMDGHFVGNISFGSCVVESIRKKSKQYFDVHLMVEHPIEYIEIFSDAGADNITLHIESVEDANMCIDFIHSFGKTAGIAINPDTSVETVLPYLDKIDMVLIMSVYPGYGGQKYIENVNKKIKILREKMGKDFLIEVDGGVNLSNIKNVVDAGANVVVAGTAVFNKDIEGSVQALMEVCES